MTAHQIRWRRELEELAIKLTELAAPAGDPHFANGLESTHSPEVAGACSVRSTDG